MVDDRKDQSKKMGQVIAKAWSDKAFKERLISNPRTVLEEHGITIPKAMDVKAVENTDKVFYLVIPPVPAPPSNALEFFEERAAAAMDDYCYVTGGLLGG
jgi:hypothetical protein